MVDIARLQIKVDSSGITVAGHELDSLAKKGTRVGTKLTAALTVPLVGGMAAAVREAALLEGALDKFDVVFQGMNEEMREFVTLYNQEFPISRRETVELAAALQDLLVPMGINREIAAGMTKDWLELAGALSAFNDVPIQQVLDAMRSGIAGMTRPLREFGIDARATVLEQVALEEGLIRAGEAMNEQVRQQALLIQATRQSTDAIEGLEEQKGSLLWQIEELKRDTKDLAAVYGEELIPIARELITSASDLATWFKNLDEDTQSLIVKSGLLVAAVGPAVGGLSWAYLGLSKAVFGATKAIKGMTTAMAANPYFLAAAGVAALGVEIYKTHQETTNLETALSEAFDGGLSSMDEANQLIVQIEERIASLRQAGIESGWMDTEEVQRLQNALARIIEKRDELALKEGMEFFAEDQPQVVETVSNDFSQLNQWIEDSIFLMNEWWASVDRGGDVEGMLFNRDGIDEWNQATNQALEDVRRKFRTIETSARIFSDFDENATKIQVVESQLQSLIENGVNPNSAGMVELIQLYNKLQDEGSDSANELQGEIDKTAQAAKDLGFTFSSAFEDAIVRGESFRTVLDGILQDILRIITRTLVTEPLGNALSGAFSGSSLFSGGVETAGDALITNSGRVIKFDPKDNFLAMKDFSPLINNQTNVSTPVNVSVNNYTDSNVEVQERRSANGGREIELLITNAMKSAFNSGKMDTTMRQYGVRRQGVNRG